METAEYASRVASIATTSARQLVRQWDKPGLWADKVESAALLLSVGQLRAADLAETYAVSQLGAADLTVQAGSFAGVASDGRSLSGLLMGASAAADRKEAAEEASRAAKAWLEMAALTQVADVARAALRTTMAVRDAGGIRIATPPCCDRCAVLHGRHYSWRAGFPRHPACNCTYALTDRHVEEIPLDQIRGLSQADRQAIDLGANRNSVINAQRGMYTADLYGRRVKATFDSTAHRTSAFPTRDNTRTVRLRPESILRHATDREDAIRLLTKYGYI